MKSVNEMIRFLHRCIAADKRTRRSQTDSTSRIVAAETVEARLLLTADVNDALFNALSAHEIAPDFEVESYLVRFDSAQNTGLLQQSTGAHSVSISPFVENLYTLEFDSGMTLQDAADTFTALTDFDYMHPNVLRTFETRAVPNDPLYGDQWHLSNTGQGGGMVGIDANIEPVWDNFTGAGVTIGIVDDGFEHAHEDLVANANTTIDFDFNDNDNDPSPGAGDFHGTAVGGVASAVGNNGIGVSGAAWNAELVGLRLIASGFGDGTSASALTHEMQTIDIYNNSWGPPDNGQISSIGPQTLAALEQSATTGRGGLGNIHVWAAGNGGDRTNDNVNYDPFANSRHTIAVGALRNTGIRSDYSDTGASLVVVAGSNGGTLGITTTDITGTTGYSNTNYANDFGGTSSATPLVSGIIALMLEANPNLTYRDVTDILAHTSERVDANNADWVQNGAGLWVNHEYGFGAIDASAAVDAALTHQLLTSEESYSTGTQTINQTVPEGGAGVSSTVSVPQAENMELEYVEVVFNATHSFIGDLQVTLTSPHGTRSVLAETRTADGATAYSDYVFTSTRHWDETSAGDWTVTVVDAGGNGTGSFDSYELRFYGTDPLGIKVAESGGSTVVSDFTITDSFDVSLPLQPTTDVVIDIVSRDTTEVVVSASTLTFTSTNWDRPQTINVSGVLDLVVDGPQQTDVVLSIDSDLSDPLFIGASPVTLSVTSLDDDGNVPGKPTLTSPEAFPDDNQPIFAWTPGIRSDNFALSITNVLTGQLVQQTTGILGNSFSFAIPFPDGLYEATVQAFNPQGQGSEVSDPLVFNIGEAIVPAAPMITAPSVGSFVNTSRPVIQWTAVPGATQYELYFLSSGVVTRITTPGTDAGNGELAYIPAQALKEGVNSVWIRGFNFFGEAGPWSAATRFTVDAVGLPTTPRITAPLVSTTSNAFPTFAWTSGGPNASTYELWVSKLRIGTGTAQVQAVYDRVLHVVNHTELSYQHFKALGEGTYRVWARAFNSSGESSLWSAFEQFDIAVPVSAPPTLVGISNTQDTTPTFRWGSSGDVYTPGTTFRLWVNNLSTGTPRVIDVSGISDTFYTPTEPLDQGRLAAWVQATNATGQKSPWSERIIINLDVLPPTRPIVTGPVADEGEEVVDVQTKQVENEFPEFSWTASVNAASYELWVNHVDSGTARIVHVKGIEGTTYTHDLPIPEGNIRAWVRAYNIADEVSEWSAAFNVFVNVPTPSVPTIVAPKPNAVGSVADATPTIGWQTILPGSTYDLQLEDTLTGERIVDISGIEGLTYTVPTTLSERTHRVRVRAVNSVGEVSAWTDWYVFVVDVPNATTPVALAPTGTVIQSKVLFQWRHSPDSVRYEILVKDLRNNEDVVFRTDSFSVDPGNNVATHSETLANGSYRFWVRAFNSQGTASGWSSFLSFIVDDRTVSLDSKTDIQVQLTSFVSSPDAPVTADTATADEEAAETHKLPPHQPASQSKIEEQQDTTVHAEYKAIESVMAEFADPQSTAVVTDERGNGPTVSL